MIIYPAIDIKSGQCVRLMQGRYDQSTVYSEDPITMAKYFMGQGTSILHIVDLDGAQQGKLINLELIKKIVEQTALKIQMGGGIRTKNQVRNILNSGISRVILGSIAISKPQEVKQWIAEFGNDRIVLALDIRMNNKNEPQLALHGWQKESRNNLWEILDEYQSTALKHVLCTDIQRDGTLSGPNISLYKECKKRYPTIIFQASGGISNIKDLKTLVEIPVAGAIVGKALYENKFSLNEALREVSYVS